MPAAEQDPHIAKGRDEWRAGQPDLNPENPVVIDETWAKTNMARLYGRALRGQRLVAPVPHGHWMTTFVALRHDEIAAPCVFDGPMEKASFGLCRALSRPGLAPWRCRRIILPVNNRWRERSDRAGRRTLRYLPANSPDLNPLEHAFAKLKAALRKATARTFGALIEAIPQALADVTPEECAN